MVRWWTLTASYALVIAVVSVIPIPRPIGNAVGRFDKLMHLCEYLLLAWCVVQAARASGFPHAKTLVVAWLFPASFGLFLEGVQSLLPYRSAEGLDVLANAIGAGLGAWIGLITSGKPMRKSIDHSP